MKLLAGRLGRDSAWLQASRLAFIVLYGITLLAALGWLLTNVRQIGPDNSAVVLRMGMLDRMHNSGLLMAWPRPFEQVVLVPSAERVLERRVETLLRSREAQDVYIGLNSDEHAGSGYLLTGDAGVVQLEVVVFYKVTDPFAYVLQGEHVLPALDRLVTGSAVTACASRDLDTILVARPELLDGDSQAAERRERLRGDLVQKVNQRLAALEEAGAGLGLRVDRVDVQSSLPADAVYAFNKVLTASQLAEQNIASARNEAAKQSQAATQSAERSVQVASAQASELLAEARSDTAYIVSLAQTQREHSDPGLLQRLYRERVPKILAKAAHVTSMDSQTTTRLIIPGPQQ